MKDLNNKELEVGHIVVVKYVWNSYVGVIRLEGLSFESEKFSPSTTRYHPIKKDATYQILGHIDKAHKDYSEEVYQWYYNIGGKCPIKIKVYDENKNN